MFRSIRTRLTFSHLAAIVVAMVLSGFLLLSLLQRYFLEAMEQSLIAQARLTAQVLIPGALAEGPAVDEQAAAYDTIWQQRTSDLNLQAENVAPLQQMQQNEGVVDGLAGSEVDLSELADASLELSSQLDTRIRVVDANGTVLVDTQPGGQGQDLSGDVLVGQALAGQYANRTDQASFREQAMHVAMPVEVDGNQVGVVYLSQSLNDVTAVLNDLTKRWLLSTAIGLILSAVVGLLLSRAIARPLRRLTAAAGAVARGDLNQQVPVRSRDELGRLSSAFNDMTFRLRHARQVQTDFVANVSHELRTPLTAVKGLVETLRGGAVDDPEVRDHFLETVEGETDRLIRLVNDLLLLSRADSEALNLQREEVDLVALAQSVLDRLAQQAEAAEVTLRLGANPNRIMALIDADRIEQVLLNLLDNAIKYSRLGGTVVVAVEAGDPVTVQIRDRGIGIPVDDLARIGERFYRADRARSRAEGGSGLGLAIAQAFVAAHGGELKVHSVEEQGTVVTFTLPSP